MRLSMRLLLRPIAAVVLTAAGVLFAPTANAEAQSPSPSLSDQAPNIPDQKIDAAAAALEQVATIRKEYQQRLETAPESRQGAHR